MTETITEILYDSYGSAPHTLVITLSGVLASTPAEHATIKVTKTLDQWYAGHNKAESTAEKIVAAVA